MKKSNFALRLQPSLMEETRKVANAEAWPLISSSTLRLRRSSPHCARRSTSPSVRRGETSRGRFTSSSEPESGTGPFQVTSSRFVDHGDAPLGHQGSGGEVGHGETSPQDGITRPGFGRARRATRARAAGCG